MAREVISELVSVARLDTAQYAREAKAHADRLRGLKAAQDQVTTADKQAAAATAKLRQELIGLRREEVAGTGDKKELAKQAAQVRLRLQEQAESTRQLKEHSRDLRAEQKQLQVEMRATAQAARNASREEATAARDAAKAASQAARERARAVVAAAKQEVKALREVEQAARAAERADIAAHRERANNRRLQEAGLRNTLTQKTITDFDARLMQLNKPFGGVRAAAHDAVNNLKDNWRDKADDAIVRGVQGIPGAAASVGRTAVRAGATIGGGALALGAGIASRGAEFENLRTSLETVEGSAQKAAASFALIQEFASKTPYGVQETTESLVKLKARGLDASLPALTAYGDTAAAMGKTLDDVVEAVADATTGEFERLKEFGIKAKTEGDKVQFTFRGTTETVAKSSADIEKYLQRVGKVNFAGGMERQSKTLSGQLSTLSDTVSQLADTAFQGGLGQALKDIVADMSGAAGGANDLAATVGHVLGTAATDAYKAVKDFIGPVDQLPGKLKDAAGAVGDFASGLGSIVKFGVEVVDRLGVTNTAIIGIGIAATAALGPMGLLLGLGLGLGKAFTSIADEVERWRANATGIPGYKAMVETELQSRRERSRWAEEETKKLEESNAERDASLSDRTARGDRATSAESRFRAARLRALGVTSEDALTKTQRDKLNNQAARVFRKARDAGELQSRDEVQGGSADELISSEEGRADKSEYDRLKAARGKGKLATAQQKRLKELADKLGVVVPGSTPKAKKEKLNAFEAERKQEIDTLVKRAELDAADKALASGNAAGAEAAAENAGKATRERLTAQAKKGALPGEVERALLREAGFEDAKNTPPPPVIVYQQQFTVTVTVPLEAMVTMSASSAEAAGNNLSQQLQTILQRDIIPATRDAFRTSIRR